MLFRSKAGRIGEPTDALVTISAAPAVAAILGTFGLERLVDFFVVADVVVEEREGAEHGDDRPTVRVERSPYEKCARCWVLRPSVAARESQGGAPLCDRCARVLEGAAS